MHERILRWLLRLRRPPARPDITMTDIDHRLTRVERDMLEVEARLKLLDMQADIRREHQ